MKLSEAILIGSRQTEPITRNFADFYYTRDGVRVECRCALGAACYAVDPAAPVESMYDVEKLFGEEFMSQTVTIRPADFTDRFVKDRAAHLVPNPFTTGLANAVVRMNDYYKLKREDIAAVLQTLGF